MVVENVMTTETDNDGTEEEHPVPKRRRYIAYDRERAHNSIQDDYLGENPRFDSSQFQRMFRVSYSVYNRLKEELLKEDFYNVGEYNRAHTRSISVDAKILIALKHLGHGCSANAWVDYFQMGESTSRLCVEMFCRCIAFNKNLREEYLRSYTVEDAKEVTSLHETVHGVPGMLGSLDCMHVVWKNCPVALQGTFKGKEKSSTIVLEAVADHNLRFWHAAFGFPGSCNDINILDASPLHSSFLDGSHSKIDFSFTIGDHCFNNLYYLVDGIYPPISRFVKTISSPINRSERIFAGWQEAARKDVERAFGVLQMKWRMLANPVERWDEIKIQQMVIACIIMHNMMVDERVSKAGDYDGMYFDHSDCFEIGDGGIVLDDAEQRVLLREQEEQRLASINNNYTTHKTEVINERWTQLYDERNHARLRDALVKKVTY